MASTMAAPSLPSKKRKASVASNNSSLDGIESTSNNSNSNTNNAAATPAAARNEPTTEEASATTASLDESRLPSKKRKGSHDSSVQFEEDRKRKESNDSCVHFEEDSSKRKDTMDSSALVESKRKDTMDSSALVESKRKDTMDSSALFESKRKDTMDSSFLVESKRKDTMDSFALFESKRKDTMDSTNIFESKRKDTMDSSALFESDFWRRKSSLDSTYEDPFSKRKLSDNSSVRIDDLLAVEPLLLSSAPTTMDSAQQHTDTQSQVELSALEHLEALGMGAAAPLPAPASAAAACKPARRKHSDGDEHSSNDGTINSPSQNSLVEAILMAGESQMMGGGSGSAGDSFGLTAREPAFPRGYGGGRDRLESWGGMSDLSIPLGSAEIVMASALQQQQQHQQTLNLLMDGDLDESKPSAIPGRIAMGRERINSLASMSEADLSGLGGLMVDGVEVSGDIQAFVAAAMASVGDQLAELAGVVETAASGADAEAAELEHLKDGKSGLESENSSVASPLIGAMSDTARIGLHGRRNRPRSWSASSGKISVDYDAVAAAVDAAQAATGTLDLATIGSMAPPPAGMPKKKSSRRQLPLYRNRGESASSDDLGDPSNPMPTPVKSSMSDLEMERIRERARAAAGYKPPSKKGSSSTKKSLPPIKKRAKRNSPEPDKPVSSLSHMRTPKASNKTTKDPSTDHIFPPLVPSSEASKSSKGQAIQKWESMFDCLIGFIDDHRQEETTTMPEDEKDLWVWDGNVPTTYKTKDGKALGRWVNNQRSAKSKGSLKEEREHRLVDAGLKWSVLASNSWNEMLEELRIYVTEVTKQGRKWDGNVPTNYQIKTRPNGRFAGEDKNLGRWVNRQRSLFQAGKLRKDRQLSLEKLGLKWSMLATTSWDSMYETLCEYVEKRKREGGDWDGNVPANYRTDDLPPRALGRWINRQRSAFMKQKLKKEYTDKLNTIGLKWSVHERCDRAKGEEGGDEFDDEDDEDNDSVGSGDRNETKDGGSSGKENAEDTGVAEATEAKISSGKENAEDTEVAKATEDAEATEATI